MGNRYQFKLNQKEPDKERITSYMDFDAVLADYQAKNAGRKSRLRVWYITLLAAAAIAALILSWNFLSSEDTGTTPEVAAKAYFASRPFIAPPLPHIKIPEQKTLLNSNLADTLEFESGATAYIPSQAFADDRGRLIEGEVKLVWKEMKDPVDFFLAGIPMTYDSAGKTYQLESAGMIEVYGIHQGRKVQLAPGKQIAVELITTASFDPSNLEDFQVYQLDTQARNWVHQEAQLNITKLSEQGKKSIAPALRQLETDYAADLAQLEAGFPELVPPIPSLAHTGNLLNFKLPMETQVVGDNPRARQLIQQQVIWVVLPENGELDERMFDVAWKYALKQLNPRTYELQMRNGDTYRSLLITPLLNGSDLQQAQLAYRDALERYNQQIKERERELASARQALKDTYEAERRELEASASLNTQLPFQIQSRFIIEEFGIWNVDRPLLSPKTEKGVRFVDQNGLTYNQQAAYAASKNQNTLFELYTGQGESTTLPDSNDPVIWLITPEGRLAVHRPEDKPGKLVNGTFTLKVEVMENAPQTAQDVRRILAL